MRLTQQVELDYCFFFFTMAMPAAARASAMAAMMAPLNTLLTSLGASRDRSLRPEDRPG